MKKKKRKEVAQQFDCGLFLGRRLSCSFGRCSSSRGGGASSCSAAFGSGGGCCLGGQLSCGLCLCRRLSLGLLGRLGGGYGGSELAATIVELGLQLVLELFQLDLKTKRRMYSSQVAFEFNK